MGVARIVNGALCADDPTGVLANFTVNCAGLMALLKANGAATTALQCGTPVNARLPAPLNASLPPNTTLSNILLCPVSCGGCGAACSDPFAAVLAAANTTCVALKSKCNASLSTVISSVPSKIHVKHACMKECSYCTTTAAPTAASATSAPTAAPPTKASSAYSVSVFSIGL